MERIVSVLLLDRDSRRCRDRLTALARSGLVAAESAERVEDWLPRDGRLDPDVFVVSADTLRPEEIDESLAALEPRHPQARLLLVDVPQEARRSPLTLTAWGSLGQGEPFPHLLEAVCRIAAGQALLSGERLGRVMRQLQDQSRLAASLPVATSGQTFARLTARERQVLGLLAEQRTNREIAGALSLEVGTVKNHVHSILKKLGLQNRWQAMYLESGFAGAPSSAMEA
jgi:DNA-binding NarL/FixJ family response regulator